MGCRVSQRVSDLTAVVVEAREARPVVLCWLKACHITLHHSRFDASKGLSPESLTRVPVWRYDASETTVVLKAGRSQDWPAGRVLWPMLGEEVSQHTGAYQFNVHLGTLNLLLEGDV
jgi:hypothetical protein